MRPAVRRRVRSLEELAAIADVDAAELERRLLREIGPKDAVRHGVDLYSLSDPGWRRLLGEDFVDVLAAGGVRAHRELVAAVGDHDGPEDELPIPVFAPPIAPKAPAPRRRSSRPRRGWALVHIAHLYGEEVELQ